ncbi:MAG TPA: division plane positioning ATPase MipZ, partial [Acidimicrobiia bacterium]|nr:division plane positioning ATPase MipZ [Acidimicrobiia bacterium]
GVAEAAVRASIRRAAEAALNRRGRPSSAALRPALAPPSGWFDVPPAATEPELRATEPNEAENPPEADGPAEAELTPVGQGEADVVPPAQLVEWAMRSVANGTPVTAVARWFNVPESELRGWINEPPADPGPPTVTDTSMPQETRVGVNGTLAGGAEADVAGTDEVAALPPAFATDDHSHGGGARREDSGTIVEAPGPRRAAGSQAPNPTYDRNPAEAAPTTRTSPSARRTPTVYSSNRAVVTGRRSSPPSPMTLRDSLHVLRRRLLIVLAVAILGVAGGWVSAPGKSAGQVSYRATHTLIYEPHGNQSFNIQQIALLASSGEVPSRVAARLKLDRNQVRSAVSAVANPDVATIAITGRSADPAGAVLLADVTAEELVTEITGADQAAYDAQLKQLTGQVDAARARLNAIPAKNAPDQAAAKADVTAAEQALQQYKSTPAPNTQLRTLEKASAAAVSPAGVKAPNSKTGRALLLGALGLLVGIASAFALDRLDSRIRSKSRAEEAFGAPVVAEVPPIGKSLQGRLLTRTDPTSPFIESYRGLRTYVALWAPETGDDDGHRVILVTSPGASEGKTTTVAHLAAMLAEIGRSVVVISADLRRPRIHQYFDLPEGPGLVDALAAGLDAPEFDKLDRPTPVRNVRLVPSGPSVNNPAPLLEHAADLIRATRPLADFVLIDCPPLLVANDAVEMARHADGVLL